MGISDSFWTIVGSSAGVVAAVLAYVQIRLSRARMPTKEPISMDEGMREYSARESNSPPIGRLPRQVHGRDELISDLLSETSKEWRWPRILVGTGGVGKSTVALEFAKRVKISGWTTWWIRADSADRFSANMITVAMQLLEISDDGTLPPIQTLVDRFWIKLEQRRDWLIVIDNLDDTSVASINGELLQHGNGWIRASASGMVVVTSRQHDASSWGRDWVISKVGELDEGNAGSVLLDLAPDAGNEEDAIALALQLFCFPLALHQAGSHIASPLTSESTFVEYSELLQRSYSMALAAAPGSDSDFRKAVATSWKLSAEALERQGISVTGILHVMSCLHSSEIPPEVLMGIFFTVPEVRKIRENKGKWKIRMPILREDAASVRNRIHALASVGLITLSQYENNRACIRVPAVTMHPLLQAVVWDEIHGSGGRLSSRQFDDLKRIVNLALNSVAIGSILITEDEEVDEVVEWDCSATWEELSPHLIEVIVFESPFLDKRHLGSLLMAGISGIGAFLIAFQEARFRELENAIFSHIGPWGTDYVWAFVNLRMSTDNIYYNVDRNYLVAELMRHGFVRKLV